MIGLLRADEHPPAGAILIDARTGGEYEAGHLAGAIHLAWEEWCAPAPGPAGPVLAQPGYWGVLAEAASDLLAARLGSHGISSDRPLVVYAGGVRSRGRDGRIAWMLAYLGAHQVFLLDGGLRMWIDRGAGITTEPTRAQPQKFDIQLQPGRRVDLSGLRRIMDVHPRPLLIDTRSEREYAGEVDEYLPRRGHLPGALLLPFTDLYGDGDRFVPRQLYLDRLPARVLEQDRVIAYCEVGVRAGTFALLHEVYTGRVVAVFDGSLMQWSLDPTFPMERGGGMGSEG